MLQTTTKLSSFLRIVIFAFASAATVLALEWQEVAGYRRAEVQPTGSGTGLKLLSPSETGINFTNHLSNAALARNQILEVGSGVALGDVDGDGWVDLYFSSMHGGNRLFRNRGNWRFEDITAQSGTACAGQFSTGAALADLDGDLDLDLLVTGIGAGARLFMNNGHGNFTETEAGLAGRHGSTSMAIADIDLDGDLDLYIANYHTRTVKDSAQPNVTVRQVDGQLQISPPGMFLPLYGKSGSISLFERGEPDVLYLNDGKGRFRPLSWTGGAFLDDEGKPLVEPPKEWGLSVMFRDINSDGAPDIYVCNDFFHSPDHLWLNDGKGAFRLAPPETLRHTSMSSMAVDFADINRDELDDLFVLDMMSRDHARRHRQRASLIHVKTITPTGDPSFRPEYPRNTLFLNRGDGTYAEIAALAGLEASEWSWSASFMDVDLDGFEDLLITNGNLRNANDADASGRGNLRFGRLETPNLLFRNEGTLTFREIGSEWGFDQSGVSHGMALGDLDNDGDLDVIINNMGAAAAVYRNETASPRIAVRLKGGNANSHGIGARITLKHGAVPSQSQEVLGAGRYLSSDDGTRVFAAGKTRRGMSLEVLWPGGRRSVVNDIQANSIYEISHTSAEPFARQSPPPIQPLFENVSSSLRPTHHDSPFDDWALQPLLPHALSQGGPGVGWFDLDQDGRDDLIAGNGRGGFQVLFLNTAAGFKPMKRAENLPGDQTTLLAWRDKRDVRLLAGFSNYELGETNAPGVIEYNLSTPQPDQAFAASPDAIGPLALGVVRGEMALFVGGRTRHRQFPHPVSSRIFLRKGDRWILDPDASALLAKVGMVNSATWADLDADGHNELILACDWGPIKVFETKTGKLVERTADLGFDRFRGRWNGVAAADFNGDGLLEIVASNFGRNTKYERHRHHPIRLYYGDWNEDGSTGLLEAYHESSLGGHVPFTTLDVIREVLPEIASRFPTFAVYAASTVEQILADQMDRTEFLEASWFETSIFWRVDDKWQPRPLPVEAQFSPAFGIAPGDANGDGNEDLFLAQNFFAVDAETPRHDGGLGLWLLGDGNGNFTPLSSRQSGVALLGEQRGSALADFNNDGRLDLAVGQNRGPFALFKNVAAKPALRVRLRGPAENPDGISAAVRIRFENGWSPVKQIQAGSGYWSQPGINLLFGLPTRPLEVHVRWPGGSTTVTPVADDATEVVVTFDPTP